MPAGSPRLISSPPTPLSPGSVPATACPLARPSAPTWPSAFKWGGIDVWFDEVASQVEIVELGGEWIAHPWDLVAKNADHLARDFAIAGRSGLSRRRQATAAIIGSAERLFIHETARIDPYTVFDTTGGPITIAAGWSCSRSLGSRALAISAAIPNCSGPTSAVV